MDNNRPIGVFDSGLGGLTVLKKLVKTLPGENYIYFGDTARIPYGEKTREELIRFSREILDWFQSQNVKAVLMACNTSSANTLETVKDEYDFPVLGLIEPASRYVACLKENKIGLMATSATIKSGAYVKGITDINNKKEVFETACPGLVELVESGNVDSTEAKELVSSYILPLLNKGAQKIVLGCTHYPYLSSLITSITSNSDLLIDPADFLVEETRKVLSDQNLCSNSTTGCRKYYVSGSVEKFLGVGNKFYDDCTSASLLDVSEAILAK